MEPFLGQVIMVAGSYAPRGWAYCEGQLMQITENPALFSLLGVAHGGDGRTNFALPDMREAEKAHPAVRFIIAIDGAFPPRN